ncbi:MAG: (d)CMP kinase [Deltaproteobacteria bacterium]|nr:(d)CMP kinase [Deltaproteobacteria bacterium]
MSSKKILITLDGPSGSGKSTASVKLAYHFQLPCLDTGAMYRFVGLRALEKKIPLSNEDDISKLAAQCDFQFRFEGEEPIVEAKELGEKFQKLGKEIRSPEVSLAASAIAKLKKVREVLVKKQQEIGEKEGGVIEGRDAGTTIFPQAGLKFFMTADVVERAKRRYAELKEKLGTNVQAFDEVLKEMVVRDKQDEERAFSPLKPADDAIIYDTSGKNFDEVVQFLIQTVRSRLKP